MRNISPFTDTRLLARTTDIRISETEHGPAGDRRYSYTPIFMLRGLEQLHVEFTPRTSPLTTPAGRP